MHSLALDYVGMIAVWPEAVSDDASPAAHIRQFACRLRAAMWLPRSTLRWVSAATARAT
jgi:hypothetical protein